MAAHEKEYGHYAQPSFKSLKSLAYIIHAMGLYRFAV